ncbi:hypothetical protein D3C86_2108330 [compost metagenome]
MPGKPHDQGGIRVFRLREQYFRRMALCGRLISGGERMPEQGRMGLGVAGIEFQARLPEARRLALVG